MKNTPQSKSEGLRLTVDSWIKLRWLMQHHNGRAWLERIIQRAHKKIQDKNDL